MSTLNPDGSFMSEHEIIIDIIERKIPDAETRLLVQTGFRPPSGTPRWFAESESRGLDPYFMARSCWTRWIRDEYGLWASGNPHVVHEPEPDENGEVKDPRYPHNLADRITEKVMALLRADVMCANA